MGYFDPEFATVEYDDSTGCVIAALTEFSEGEKFQAYMNSIIGAIEDNDTDRMVADTSDMGALSEEDQLWSVKDWSPRAEESGLEHMALVMPESVIAEMSVESVTELADDTLNRGFFEDEEEAKEWLQEQ